MTLLLPKQTIVRDPQHLRMVRQLPCCLSGNPFNVQAHHLVRTGGHCMGRKSGDNFTLPIRADLHQQLHDGPVDETLFLHIHGVEDGAELALELWALTEQGLKGEEWLSEGRRIIEQ